MPFLLKYVSRDTRCIDFRWLTGSQRTPRVLGCHIKLLLENNILHLTLPHAKVIGAIKFLYIKFGISRH